MPDIIAFNTRSWSEVTVRMQQVGRGVQGVAKITMEVLVCYGNPTHWKEPKVEPIEPKAAANHFVDWIMEGGENETV